jgi:hypothetical protein
VRNIPICWQQGNELGQPRRVLLARIHKFAPLKSASVCLTTTGYLVNSISTYTSYCICLEVFNCKTKASTLTSPSPGRQIMHKEVLYRSSYIHLSANLFHSLQQELTMNSINPTFGTYKDHIICNYPPSFDNHTLTSTTTSRCNLSLRRRPDIPNRTLHWSHACRLQSLPHSIQQVCSLPRLSHARGYNFSLLRDSFYQEKLRRSTCGAKH